MAALRDEERFDQEHQRGQRTVKMEKGQVWTVRFLPVQLGEEKTWYARIARHWLNKKPIICPVDTAAAFNGDKDAYCPCCVASAEINRSSDDDVSKFGFSCRASSQRLTFCIVIDKDGDAVTGNEMLMAYEFWHYQNTWDELKAFFKAGTRGGKNMTSVLDYKTGNDFAVSRNAKGLRLDKQDSAPIFDPTDPNFDSYIKKIEDSVKQPKVKIPTARELEIFAAKIEEDAERIGRGGRPASRKPASIGDEDIEGNGGGESDAGAEPARPPRRPPPLPPVKNPPPPPVEEEEPAAAQAPAPAPKPAARRPAPPPPAEPPEEEEDPASEEQAAPRPNTTIPRKKAVVPPPDADADLWPETGGEDAPEATPTPRRAPAAAAAAEPSHAPKRASPIPGNNDKVDDDPEVLPEEPTDQAPPVRQPLRKAVAAPVEQEQGEEAEAPAAPVRKVGLGTQLRDKVRQIAGREGA